MYDLCIGCICRSALSICRCGVVRLHCSKNTIDMCTMCARMWCMCRNTLLHKGVVHACNVAHTELTGVLHLHRSADVQGCVFVYVFVGSKALYRCAIHKCAACVLQGYMCTGRCLYAPFLPSQHLVPCRFTQCQHCIAIYFGKLRFLQPMHCCCMVQQLRDSCSMLCTFDIHKTAACTFAAC